MRLPATQLTRRSERQSSGPALAGQMLVILMLDDRNDTVSGRSSG
jgi:hypothetical protein